MAFEEDTFNETRVGILLMLSHHASVLSHDIFLETKQAQTCKKHLHISVDTTVYLQDWHTISSK